MEEENELKEVRKYLVSITPRDYQEKIFLTAVKNNTLVVLPTGLGKTLIALMLSIHRLIKFPNSKILFLAPTRPLAEQHYNYFKKYLPDLFADMILFTGKIKAEKRKEQWQNANIIFSTPQCISNDIKNNLYSLQEVSLLIEDECHRCIKNYSYTYIAKKYKEQAKNFKILGLTASPGSEKEKIRTICQNLEIEKVELRNRESEDVKQYLQKLKFEVIKLDFPEELQKLRNILKKVYDKKIEELIKRKLLFGKATKKNLLETQHKIMKAISTGNRHFNLLSGASACAVALKIQHAIELIETQTLVSAFEYLQDLFRQSEKEKSKAVKQIVKSKEFNQAYNYLIELLTRKKENPKLEKLKEIIIEELKNKKNSKIIVFSQYRDSVIKICKELNNIENVNAKIFIGQTIKKEIGMTQKEQQEIIREFSLGKANILVSTSIGEEGLDIPEVDIVIFYEPIPSAIRKIQRAGRTARLRPGKIIILMIKKTRDEYYYWASFHKEKKMYNVINDINKEINNKKTIIKKEKNLFDY
ncbi:MAG: DEAD/DEAH box helicase family protein [Candidatus Pacearchaeota archaeon]